jgi:hypothetical protein
VTIFRHTPYSLDEHRDAAGVEFCTWEVDQPLAPPRRCNRCQCWLRRTRGTRRHALLRLHREGAEGGGVTGEPTIPVPMTQAKS